MKQDLKNYLKLSIIYFMTTIPLVFLRFPDIKNEMKYFAITDNMIQSKNFLVLKFFNELYPDKPPFYFWILSLIKTLFGENFYLFNLLIGSTLFGFIILILTYKLIKNLKNSDTAFFISVCLGTLPFFIGVSVLQRMDIMMSAFISLALYLFFGFYYNFCKISMPNLILFYFFIFMGVFTKGIAGAMVPLAAIFSFLILEKNISFLKKIKFFRGFIFILLLFGIWFYSISLCQEGKEYINLLLGQETVGRIVKSKAHVKPFYYYIKSLLYVIYPYGFIFLSLTIIYIKKIKSWKEWENLEKIGFVSSVIPVFFFSLASGKLEIYLTPVLQGIIILTIFSLKKNLNNKFIKFIFKLSEILAIFPIISNILDKNQNYKKRIKNLNISSLIIIFIAIFGLNFYNNNYTLKPFVNFIKNSDSQISSYKFSNSINLSYLNNYEIKNYDSKESIPKNCKYILKKNKSDGINDNYRIILKNKKYSLFEKNI